MGDASDFSIHPTLVVDIPAEYPTQPDCGECDWQGLIRHMSHISSIKNVTFGFATKEDGSEFLRTILKPISFNENDSAIQIAYALRDPKRSDADLSSARVAHKPLMLDEPDEAKTNEANRWVHSNVQTTKEV